MLVNQMWVPAARGHCIAYGGFPVSETPPLESTFTALSQPQLPSPSRGCSAVTVSVLDFAIRCLHHECGPTPMTPSFKSVANPARSSMASGCHGRCRGARVSSATTLPTSATVKVPSNTFRRFLLLRRNQRNKRRKFGGDLKRDLAIFSKEFNARPSDRRRQVPGATRMCRLCENHHARVALNVAALSVRVAT